MILYSNLEALTIASCLSFFSAPVEEDVLHEARKMITNEQIDLYNEAAESIL